MNLDNVLTTEMNKEQWQVFRREWIDGWAESLEVECDFSREDALFRAELDWENYCGQEGWTGRDEEIAWRRERQADPQSI